MANDCFKVSYNGSVTGNTTKLGEIKLLVDGASPNKYGFKFTEDVDYSINGVAQTAASEFQIACDGTDKNVNIFDKYKIQRLYSAGDGAYVTMNIDDLAYSMSLDFLSAGESDGVTGNLGSLKDKTSLFNLVLGYSAGVKGDLSDLSALTALKTIQLALCDISGSLNSLSPLVSADKLELLNIGSSKVTGSLNSLNGITKFTNITLGSPSIQGSVDALLEAMYNGGRQSTYVNIRVKNTACTFLNTPVSHDLLYAAFSASGITVKTAAAGDTIATYDGTSWSAPN